MNKQPFSILFIMGGMGTATKYAADKISTTTEIPVLRTETFANELLAGPNNDHTLLDFFKKPSNFLDYDTDELVDKHKELSSYIMEKMEPLLTEYIKSNIPLIVEGEDLVPTEVATYITMYKNIKAVTIYEPDLDLLEDAIAQQVKSFKDVSEEVLEKHADHAAENGLRILHETQRYDIPFIPTSPIETLPDRIWKATTT